MSVNQRNLYTGGKVHYPLCSWLISFLISCFEKQGFAFLFLKQLRVTLIDNCKRSSAPSPCTTISLCKSSPSKTGQGVWTGVKNSAVATETKHCHDIKLHQFSKIPIHNSLLSFQQLGQGAPVAEMPYALCLTLHQINCNQ